MAVAALALFGAPIDSARAEGGTSTQLSQLSEACTVKLTKYRKIRSRFDTKAANYWSLVGRKRKLRSGKKKRRQQLTSKDYVLTHPPVYKGPRWPKCAAKKTKVKKAAKSKKKKRRTIGSVRDFLHAARHEYGFVPRSSSEWQYKQAYAAEAVRVGLPKHLVVGVYALETGGIGPYARQSGVFIVDQKCRPIKAKGRIASTALGYAQLLAANTAAMAVLKGEEFAQRLESDARSAAPRRAEELRFKAKLLRTMKRDIKRGIRRYANKNGWREYVAFSKTSKGYAVHTLNLDYDIGPILQVHKLLRIKQVANKKGFRSLSGAQLELMNLVGYGRGMEMMTTAARSAPTSNFFSRRGYERNPVAKNLTAQGLLNKLGRIIEKQLKKCGSVEFLRAFKAVEQQ